MLGSATARKVEIAKELLRNGVNLVLSAVKSPVAYLSSIIASSGDPHGQKHLHALSSDHISDMLLLRELTLLSGRLRSYLFSIDKNELLSAKYISQISKNFHPRSLDYGLLPDFGQQLRMLRLRQSVVVLATTSKGIFRLLSCLQVSA